MQCDPSGRGVFGKRTTSILKTLPSSVADLLVIFLPYVGAWSVRSCDFVRRGRSRSSATRNPMNTRNYVNGIYFVIISRAMDND